MALGRHRRPWWCCCPRAPFGGGAREREFIPGRASFPSPRGETLARLVEVYEEQPIEIIKLMSANAIERVRTAALRAFADAFVLHKGKDNG